MVSQTSSPSPTLSFLATEHYRRVLGAGGRGVRKQLGRGHPEQGAVPSMGRARRPVAGWCRMDRGASNLVERGPHRLSWRHLQRRNAC